jgi:arylsulfatase A-like enzyme
MIGDFIASNVDLSDTVVIVTADHGEEFGEHGGFHRNKPYDEMLHVPLIMAGHNIAQGKVIDKQVSLINLAPTVADLCGLGKIEEFQGSSLMPVIDGQEPSRVCLSYYNRRLVDGESAPEGEAFIIRWDGWKFVNREGGDELYCLERDPRERFNLIENEPKVAQSLQSRLREEVSRLRQDQIIVNQIDMQELDVIEDRLRALGYIE